MAAVLLRAVTAIAKPRIVVFSGDPAYGTGRLGRAGGGAAEHLRSSAFFSSHLGFLC